MKLVPANGGIFIIDWAICLEAAVPLSRLLFPSGRKLGSRNSAKESISTRRQVAGWAVSLLPLTAIWLLVFPVRIVCRRFNWDTSDLFSVSSNRIRFCSTKFSSEHCFTRSSRPSIYTRFRFRESWADILLRIFRRIRFNSRSSCFVNG